MFTLPNLDTPSRVNLRGFPVSGDDLIFILREAKPPNGISTRAWQGRALPSGVKVTRDGGPGSVRWSDVQAAMARTGLASSSRDAAGRTHYELADVDIEGAIDGIRNLKSA